MNDIKMLHHDRIDVYKTSKSKECLFVTIGIFEIKTLSLKKKSTMNLTIY